MRGVVAGVLMLVLILVWVVYSEPVDEVMVNDAPIVATEPRVVATLDVDIAVGDVPTLDADEFDAMWLPVPTGAFGAQALVDSRNCTIIGGLPYVISSAGNYCLDSNLTASGGGVSINADDVLIDFGGHTIFGSTSSINTFFGIYANSRRNITIRNGELVGFMYGLRFDDSSYGTANPSAGGGHLIEHMEVSRATFRGMMVRGDGNVIRDNVVRDIWGNTLYTDSFAIGIEVTGLGAVVADNYVYEVRARGEADIGEGVGIAYSSAGMGGSIIGNEVVNSSVEPNDLTDWDGLSRSTYAIWVGGESSVVVEDNVIQNYMYGITFSSTTGQSVVEDNVVLGAYAPIVDTTVAGQVLVDNVCDMDCYSVVSPFPERE